MITATRRLHFSAGHRVYGHESKCANVHGHNYVVFITAQAPNLDSVGRVVDFSVLKAKYDAWLQEHWDHGMLIYMEDPLKWLWMGTEQLVTNKAFYCSFNPTAEEMAKWLLAIGPSLMRETEVTITKIALWETENCYAEASL